MQTQTDLWKLQIVTDRVMGARGPWLSVSRANVQVPPQAKSVLTESCAGVASSVRLFKLLKGLITDALHLFALDKIMCLFIHTYNLI